MYEVAPQGGVVVLLKVQAMMTYQYDSKAIRSRNLTRRTGCLANEDGASPGTTKSGGGGNNDRLHDG
jgi:hypothetical protein